MRLKGKIAIVTGPGQGIGQAIALAIAREGGKLALAARTVQNLEGTQRKINSMGGASLVVPTDLNDEAAIKNMLDKTLGEFGGIDILVNNSGVAGPTKMCEEVTREEWEDCFAVNMTGMFLCCKYVIPIMKKNRQGRIINISSLSGKRPLPNRTPYTASKMAVIGLTRTLAFELGEFGVTVNSVCPGATEGERIRNVIANQAESRGISLKEAEESFTGQAALKTFVTAEDTAGMCVHLASEDGKHMTGQDINVTAGLCWY